MSFSSWIVVAAFVAMSPALWWALEDFILDRISLPERLLASDRKTPSARGYSATDAA